MRWLSIFLTIIFVFGNAGPLSAAMSSTNYFIYADDFSAGGGLSTGGDYSLQDTIGSSPADISASGSYSLRSGYQYETRGQISMTISSSSLGLGTLSTVGASAVSQTTVTITTDSETGYSLSVSDASWVGDSLTDVSDGAVDGSGSAEEYGLAVSGSDATFGDDRAVVSGLTLASSAISVNSSQTVLSFKAVRGSASVSGDYSQNVTLSAMANF